MFSAVRGVLDTINKLKKTHDCEPNLSSVLSIGNQMLKLGDNFPRLISGLGSANIYIIGVALWVSSVCWDTK